MNHGTNASRIRMSKVAKNLSAIAFIWTGYIFGKLLIQEKRPEAAITEKNVDGEEKRSQDKFYILEHG